MPFRVILQTITAGARMLLSGTGRPGETITDRPYMQHFGFASVPKPGAEAVAVRVHGTTWILATDDPAIRPALQPGEACLFNAAGDEIRLKADGTIAVTASKAVEVVAPSLKATAMTSAEITAPTITVTGNVAVTGTITATGPITGPNGSI